MWISKIKLNNFKSYESAEFNFPEPTPGNNIVLIGAMNGHGKTTLLESLYLCLYGEEATRHLKRAGFLDKTSYNAILKNALHHNAQAQYSHFKMTVELTIMSQSNQNNMKGIRVIREWVYDQNREYMANNDSCRMWLLTENGEQVVPQEDFKINLNTYGLPFNYAPFFFFDGEKIVSQAEKVGAGFWLKDGLEGLCGITLLSDLEDDLKKYVNTCLQSISVQDQDSLRKKDQDLDEERKRLEKLTIERDKLELEESKLTEEEETLQNQLGGGVDAKSTEELRESISKAKESIKRSEEKIVSSLKTLPMMLLPQNLVIDLQKTLLSEEIRLHYDISKQQGEHKIEDFQKAFANSKSALKILGEMILKSREMREAIKEAWDMLWSPMPENCATEIHHNYLTVQSHQNINNIILSKQSAPIQLGEVCELIAKDEALIESYQKELNKLAGSSNDELLKELRRVSSELKDVVSKRRGKQEAQTACETRVAFKESELAVIKQKIMDGEPSQKKSQRATKTLELLSDLKSKLIESKLSELSEVATRINKQLAHGERIQEIKIAPNGKFDLFGQNNQQILAGISAGQTQILIMALVSALAQVTHYQAPYVIDTPLARLDAKHRQRLFDHWSSQSQQVILLSQDTEITDEVNKQLSRHIQKTYLVSAENLASGGARSMVTENAYFS